MSLLAPRFTARLAARRFLTASRRPASPRDQAILQTGQRFHIEADGRSLAAWSWGEGPTVVLMHGWGSRAARMSPFVEPLLARGYSVVAFDGPGHGESEGATSSVVELAAALVRVLQATASTEASRGEVRVIAHSIGGVASLLALRSGVRYGRLAMLASPWDLASSSTAFAMASGVTPEVFGRMRRLIERRLALDWTELTVPRLLPDSPPPLLLVHDRDDADVPFTDAERIHGIWAGSDLHATRGLGHRRIVSDPGVVRQVVDFMSGPGDGAGERRVA